MSEDERGPTNDQMSITTTSVNLPDEIFKHHIWKHFSFNRWIRVFSLVCKKWKRICEESTVDPKQIHIEYKSASKIGHYIQIVKKYQPTILRVDLQSMYAGDLFLVHRLCEASKRLHTLVLECNPYTDFDMYVKPIKNITTLALKVAADESFWQNLGTIFPNLKRFQVEQPNRPLNIKVDHLTLVVRSDSSYNRFSSLNPDVAVIRRDKKIVTKLGSGSTTSRELTYEEYFRYFGDTELLSVVNHINYSDTNRAVELLRSGATTMEYEKELYASNDSNYEYPSISRPLVNSRDYWSDLIKSSESYNSLIETNLIPVPSWKKFDALCGFKQKKEALVELSKLDDATLTDTNSGHEVRVAFLFQLLPLATKAEIRQKRVIENVKKIVQSADIRRMELGDFNKISDLRDWSDHYALTHNIDLCYAMIAAGCKIPTDEFGHVAMTQDIGIIIDLLVKNQDPSKLVDALVYCPLDKLKNFINKHNIALTIEKDGNSLFNMRFRHHVSTEEELIEYKHLVNHMDSSGRTPLSVVLEYPCKTVWSMVKKLLELGADPTLHRGDKLSPLGCVLVKFCTQRSVESYQVIDIINLLVEFGADVNAPCLHRERMCSPLMIAVLHYVDENIIRFLIAMGCRTDYVDETGRTVMDCCVQSKSQTQIANLLKS